MNLKVDTFIQPHPSAVSQRSGGVPVLLLFKSQIQIFLDCPFNGKRYFQKMALDRIWGTPPHAHKQKLN
jgi:hypothetical protein